MNKYFSSIQYLREQQKRFPLVIDKSLYDLINGIIVNEDINTYSQRKKIFGKLYDNLTGNTSKYRLILDENLIQGQEVLVELVTEITSSLSCSNLAIVTTQTSLLEAHHAIRNQQKISNDLYNLIQNIYPILNDLENRITNLEIFKYAQIDFNNILSTWRTGGAYRELPWTLQVVLLAQEIFSSHVCIYEIMEQGKKSFSHFRSELVDKILSELNKEKKSLPSSWFNLRELLDVSLNSINKNDVELIAWLLDRRSVPLERLNNIPLLFTISKTLELEVLPTEDRPIRTTQLAIDISNNLAKKILRTTDTQEFIQIIIEETANDCLAIMYENQKILETLTSAQSSTKLINFNKPESHIVDKENSTTTLEQLNFVNPKNASTVTSFDDTNAKFGIVLAGGGARGAYQAGALKYIAELVELKKIPVPKIIAGTSIGALNGAVLASHESFSIGVSQLNKLWTDLALYQILKFNYRTLISHTTKFLPTPQKQLIYLLLSLTNSDKESIAFCETQPIEQFLREAVDASKLIKGIKLWVAVFPSFDTSKIRSIFNLHILKLMPMAAWDLLTDYIRAETGTGAKYFCVQDFWDDHDNLYNVILASAALPLAFPKREVHVAGNKEIFVDGGLSDNVPLKALADDGCTHAIVIHLDNGFIKWNQNDFPELSILEIRPQQPIQSHLLDFSAFSINNLQKLGEEDAKQCLNKLLNLDSSVKHLRQTLNLLSDTTQMLLRAKL